MNDQGKKIITTLGTIAATATALYIGHKLIKNGSNYIKHNRIDETKVLKASIDLFEQNDRRANNKHRIKFIEDNFDHDNIANREAAYLMMSACCENNLKSYCLDKNIKLKEDDNLYSTAKKLTQREYISIKNFKIIEEFVNKVRNHMAHGDFNMVKKNHAIEYRDVILSTFNPKELI